MRVIAKSEIESIDVIERSMMPEGLGYAMTTQDFRDLVRYLMLNPPINEWSMIGPSSEKQKLESLEPNPNWKQQLLGASGRLMLAERRERERGPFGDNDSSGSRPVDTHRIRRCRTHSRLVQRSRGARERSH